MKYKCFNCQKELILGHDIFYGLSISFKDIITHNNIYFKDKGLKQTVVFCENCGNAATIAAKELCHHLASL